MLMTDPQAMATTTHIVKYTAWVHDNQSAFIKGRSIHDNFRYVHSTAKDLHARKKPRLLLKIDIAKAFDSVA